jgi:hypothetical protein
MANPRNPSSSGMCWKRKVLLAGRVCSFKRTLGDSCCSIETTFCGAMSFGCTVLPKSSSTASGHATNKNRESQHTDGWRSMLSASGVQSCSGLPDSVSSFVSVVPSIAKAGTVCGSYETFRISRRGSEAWFRLHLFNQKPYWCMACDREFFISVKKPNTEHGLLSRWQPSELFRLALFNWLSLSSPA